MKAAPRVLISGYGERGQAMEYLLARKHYPLHHANR